jgi:hypothetical protein
LWLEPIEFVLVLVLVLVLSETVLVLEGTNFLVKAIDLNQSRHFEYEYEYEYRETEYEKPWLSATKTPVEPFPRIKT